MRSDVKTAPGWIGALFRVCIGLQVAKNWCVTGHRLDEKPAVRCIFFPGASHLFPPFSQVLFACPGYTSTRRTVIRSRVREVLVACFQHFFSLRRSVV